MLNSVLTNNEVGGLGYIPKTDYYLKTAKTKELPYNKRYVQCYGRSVAEFISYLLPDRSYFSDYFNINRYLH